jgi:hypothetical protein
VKALVLAFLAVVGCSGSKNKQDSSATGSGSGSAIYAKKVLVGWGITPQGASSEVFLQTTDETGKQVSHPVGTFEGSCKVIEPVEAMKALSGVSCTLPTGNIELHAVAAEPDIIVLRLKVEPGVTPDPMSREEVTRVKAPVGASIGPA